MFIKIDIHAFEFRCYSEEMGADPEGRPIFAIPAPHLTGKKCISRTYGGVPAVANVMLTLIGGKSTPKRPGKSHLGRADVVEGIDWTVSFKTCRLRGPEGLSK